MVGIVGYGAYVPQYRITVGEISSVWNKDAEQTSRGLNVREKSVPAMDEDAITISVQAARNALRHAGVFPERIGAVYVGSESHPYAVKPSATVVAEAIGATPAMTAADYEFACKAGTAAIQTCMGLVGSGMIDLGLAIGADTSQGRPGDALEYTAAAGGAAFIIGMEGIVASIDSTYSFTTDTPDFWRRDGEVYPRHGARFTGDPAYFRHVLNATQGLLDKTHTSVDDYDFFVFHQPNGKFPLQAAKRLSVPKEKVLPGLLTPFIGNTYSGATPLGLAAVLDEAKPGQRILATSFGSGAGSDSFALTVTDAIEEKRPRSVPLKKYMERKKYLTYGQYMKHRGKIRM
ncbi:MAG: hydroxymethylglutaryl-CoA synthase [Candidatus Diapherotrites archaeon]|nr:hydroxymethylglutaryl-CoA synthase [Candidatus Diapherotrites archaeon]